MFGAAHDDRGTRRRVLDVDQLDRFARGHSDRALGRWVRLGWGVFAETLTVQYLLPIVFIATVVAADLTLVTSRNRPGWTHYPVLAVGILVALLPAIWWRGPRLGRAARRLGLCWSCGYDLRGMTPDPDGCTVCPECGAAWRLPDPPGPGAQ